MNKLLKYLALLLLPIALMVPATAAAEDSKQESININRPEKDDQRGDPGVFIFDPFLMEHLPGGHFYPFVIENYAPDTTFLTEENNGFSLPDNPRVYFEGDSFTRFNWFYNGQRINSALNAGAPGVLLPFSAVNGFRLQGESPGAPRYGLDFLSPTPTQNASRLMVSGVYPHLGSYWLPFMIQPDHPTTRADWLFPQRRKIHSNYFLDYRLDKVTDNSAFTVGLNYFSMERQFNDFNTAAHVRDTFREGGQMLLADIRKHQKLSNGHYDMFGVFNLTDRSNRNAELGHYPQETTDLGRWSFLGGVSLSAGQWDLGLTLLVENEKLSPFERNFSKDLLDNDGDGFYPFGDNGELRIGRFRGTTVNLSVNRPLGLRIFNRAATLDIFADARYTRLSGSEDSHDFNALSVDRAPYLVALWQRGHDYGNHNLNLRTGLRARVDLGGHLSLLGKLLLDYSGLTFDNAANRVNLLTPGFDAGLVFSPGQRTRLGVYYGILPYPMGEDVNFFLEGGRPSGTLHWWEDHNGDSLYQDGEAGDIFGYTGGDQHMVAEDISAPLRERVAVYFSTPLSRYYSFNLKGLYKKIRNRLRVRFDGDYGFYESHGGHDIYFFDRPFGDYYLANGSYGGGYERDPFYAQLQFDFTGRRPGRWFFCFSFMAHMGMGDTAFGNGPGSNDHGILDESQAFPNTWINGFGRLDGDRGFVGRTYFGLHLAENLFLGVGFKYRDGNPFAFFNTLNRHRQWAVYYQTIKAENEKGIKGGPREDYVADISFKLTYRFKLLNRDAVLGLSFFNVLDFGAELSEYVFSGGTRDSMEMQIPRSLRLSLNWQL